MQSYSFVQYLHAQKNTKQFEDTTYTVSCPLFFVFRTIRQRPLGVVPPGPGCQREYGTTSALNARIRQRRSNTVQFGCDKESGAFRQEKKQTAFYRVGPCRQNINIVLYIRSQEDQKIVCPVPLSLSCFFSEAVLYAKGCSN